MTDIMVYDVSGEVVDVVSVNDNLTHFQGRISKGSKGWYKGTGTPYFSHFSVKENIPDLVYGEHTNVPYLGFEVVNPSWTGKYGIFQERYQPFFSDFIGSCGVKEGIIVTNSIQFERSSADVHDYWLIDEENLQGYYLIDY